MPFRLSPAILSLLLVSACAKEIDASATPAADATAEAAEAIIDAVDQMFAAMKRHDVDALRAQMVVGANIVRVSTGEDGTVEHAIVSDVDFIQGTAGDTSMGIDERFTSPPSVRIDGPVASLWGPYEVWVDGERKNCGVDAVQLARLEGRWRVTAITYTARPCAEDTAPGG